MSRFWLLALACAGGLALTTTPAFADDPKPVKKPDQKANPTETILAALASEVQFKEGINVNEVPLFELLLDFTRRYEVTFVILDESFKAEGQPNIREEKPKFAATQIRGMTLHQFLSTTLDSMGATYLVRNNTIEIVPIAHAAKVTKATVKLKLDKNVPQIGEAPRLSEPLVSAVFKEKPLNEAVAKVAEMYDLTVVVSPQAGDAKTGFVNARLLNMPADKALELLAVQADLRVVRRGTAFLITSKEHANELFNEKLDKERQLIEIQKMREAPAKPLPPAEKPPEKGFQFPPFGDPAAFPNLPVIPKGVPGLFGRIAPGK
jgi:type II secretory pathway component GspD/PulD (secretin)